MANVRHTIRQIAGTGALFAAAEIDESSPGAPALGDLSSPVGTQDDFSIADNAAGDWSLTIKNFKGPVGIAFPSIALLSSGAFGERGVKIVSSTYSSDDYTVRFRIFLTSTGVPSDGSFALVTVWAF